MKTIITLGILLLIASFAVMASAEDLRGILIKVKIPSQYSTVEPGGSLPVETEIILIQEQKDLVTDVSIEYTIKDQNGRVIVKVSETKGIILRINNVEELIIPSALSPGIYTVEVKAGTKHLEKTDSALFEVVKSKTLGSKDIKKLHENVTILASIFILTTLFFLIYLWHEYRRFKRLEERFKVSVKDLKNEDIWR